MRPPAIAFGIMCKAPLAGECKTRLCPPLAPHEAAALSRCFISDVATVIDTLGDGSGGSRGIAVYTPTGSEDAFQDLLPKQFALHPQRGCDLGERLLHATQDLLSAGYGGVCLINADSPTLPVALLRQVRDELRRPGDRVVLGPAIDGGYYLIGLKQAHPALFRDIAWSTSHVLAQTLARTAELSVPLSLLPVWYDIDDLGSLQLLLHELFGTGNPLACGDVAGSPARHSRRYLGHLLRQSDAGRLSSPGLVTSGPAGA